MADLYGNTTDLQSVLTAVNDVKSEVDTQTDLIAQIANALGGKTLPDSGGGSVETCTVTVEDTSGNRYWDTIYASIFQNGAVSMVNVLENAENLDSYVIENVVKNSIVVINMGDGFSPDSFTGGTLLLDTYAEHDDYASTIVIQITDNATIPLRLMISEE